jgi:ABC-type phosphate transport system auxiliary subunit
MADLAPLLERITGLLKNRSADPGKPLVTEMEDTLTDGYARALQLESERLRLERRIGELAHSVDGREQADELKALAGRLRDVDAELDGLRSQLGALQKHLEHVRAAA